jgi:hypothetical protein
MAFLPRGQLLTHVKPGTKPRAIAAPAKRTGCRRANSSFLPSNDCRSLVRSVSARLESLLALGDPVFLPAETVGRVTCGLGRMPHAFPPLRTARMTSAPEYHPVCGLPWGSQARPLRAPPRTRHLVYHCPLFRPWCSKSTEPTHRPNSGSVDHQCLPADIAP